MLRQTRSVWILKVKYRKQIKFQEGKTDENIQNCNDYIFQRTGSLPVRSAVALAVRRLSR